MGWMDVRVGGEVLERLSEILWGGNYGENEGVNGESNVVECDCWGEVVVMCGVLFVDNGGVVEGCIGNEVSCKVCEYD